ncbi:MAG: hypothetical protein JWO53_66 [Chlamydiia bacterium]|nr:hypothetical protein [Chlamydiia bacterium]
MTDYILYARPHGDLGKEFGEYWNAVKKSKKLKNEAVTLYPPHCSLTGFFTVNDPKVAPKLEKALEKAFHKTKKSPITLGSLKQKDTMHSVSLRSEFLKKITEQFAKAVSSKAHVAIRIKPSDKYHISLASKFNKNASKKLKQLENKINLLTDAQWSVCLYKKEHNTLSLIKECHV